MKCLGRPAVALVCLLVLAVAVACSDGNGQAPSGSNAGLRGEVTVFAAASLREAFTEIAEAYEAEYPDVNVVFNFGGTPTLRTQLEQGARADVFASANAEQMDIALAGGIVDGAASTFARNTLVVITPSDNSAEIDGVGDLASGGLKLVVANANVPVGAYTRQMLAEIDESGGFEAGFSERVMANVVSLESNVKQVVVKVELGEADAGVVYSTDVTSDVATRLQRVEVPERFNVIAEYPIALVRESVNPAAGRGFMAFVLSEAGQAILVKHGFLSAA